MLFSRCDYDRLYPIEIDSAQKTMTIFGLYGLPLEAVKEFQCLDYKDMEVGASDNVIHWIEFSFSQYDPMSTVLSFPDVLVCILYQQLHQG